MRRDRMFRCCVKDGTLKNVTHTSYFGRCLLQLLMGMRFQTKPTTRSGTKISNVYQYTQYTRYSTQLDPGSQKKWLILWYTQTPRYSTLPRIFQAVALRVRVRVIEFRVKCTSTILSKSVKARRNKRHW